MERKLIVFDIDGTLVKNSNHKISKRNLEAIRKAQELGHVVSLASGRSSNNLYPIIKKLGLDDGKTPVVGLNGAEIFSIDANQNVNYLWEESFPKDLSEKIINLAWENRVDFMTYTNNPRVNYVARIFSIFSIAMKIVRHVHLVKVKKDFSNLNYDVKKFIIYGPQERVQKMIKELGTEHFSIFRWSEATDPKGNIEINMSGVNKAVGLEHMAKILKIDQKNVIFFGDGENDIGALKWAGVGVAMGNSLPGVSDHANEQTLGVKDDGIAHWIEKNILEKEA